MQFILKTLPYKYIDIYYFCNEIGTKLKLINFQCFNSRLLMGPHSTNSFRSKSSKNGFSLWSRSIKRLEYTLKICSRIYFKLFFIYLRSQFTFMSHAQYLPQYLFVLEVTHAVSNTSQLFGSRLRNYSHFSFSSTYNKIFIICNTSSTI